MFFPLYMIVHFGHSCDQTFSHSAALLFCIAANHLFLLYFFLIQQFLGITEAFDEFVASFICQDLIRIFQYSFAYTSIRKNSFVCQREDFIV